MQSISVFLDIAKFADFRFRRKIDDFSRTQWVYHVIHILFGSFLRSEELGFFEHLCTSALSYELAIPNYDNARF